MWSSMPNTVYRRCKHSLVVIKSKLFVIGYPRTPYEVFDKFTNKFVSINSSLIPSGVLSDLRAFLIVGAISIGNKIAVIERKPSTIDLYDTENDEWCEESFEISTEILNGGCIKIPQT